MNDNGKTYTNIAIGGFMSSSVEIIEKQLAALQRIESDGGCSNVQCRDCFFNGDEIDCHLDSYVTDGNGGAMMFTEQERHAVATIISSLQKILSGKKTSLHSNDVSDISKEKGGEKQ